MLCAGYAFDTFGRGGPQFSPNQHWVLVDVRGPFAPASVPRNHALVEVRTGALAVSTDFPAVLGIPHAPDGLAWVSGERATLRYGNGTTVALADPKRPLPRQRCVP